jgi:arylformamidase
MPIYDISLPLSESLVVWPGDPPVQISRLSDMDRGDTATVSFLEMGAHAGTHVDAPLHFVAGREGVDALDLEVLVGPAVVVHARDVALVTAEVLAELPIPPGTERLLIRTRNSDRQSAGAWARDTETFDAGYVAISTGGAEWLVEQGVRLVGVDSLSVAPFDDLERPHQILLAAGVIVVEGLDLGQIGPGVYQLVCLPLKIVRGDGAPARVILMDEG